MKVKRVLHKNMREHQWRYDLLKILLFYTTGKLILVFRKR